MSPTSTSPPSRAVRDALPDAELYVDANRGWTVEQALAAIPRLVDLGVRAIEEPIDVRDTEGRLRVAAASPVPLAGDESCTSLEAVAAARDEGAIGQVSVKAARTGFTESRRIAAFCTGSELAVVVGSQYEGALGAFASVALATALAATVRAPRRGDELRRPGDRPRGRGPADRRRARRGLGRARPRLGRRRGCAAPSPGGRLMLFMAEMEVALPPDMDPAAADELKAREKAICQELQRDGRWLHLWRVAGRYANVSVFDVASPDELHELLSGLPLFPYMDIRVTALARHPSALDAE